MKAVVNAIESFFLSFNSLAAYCVGGFLQKALNSALDPRNSGIIFSPVFMNSDLIFVEIK